MDSPPILPSETIPTINMDEIVVCQECPKSDVCMIIRTLAAQHEQNKHMVEKLKEEFDVEMTLNLNASITKCPHRPEFSLL